VISPERSPLPITKSAKKSLKVSRTKREQNKVQEVELGKALKKVSASNINEVISKIDKAAKNHLISKNKAARLKSRLSKKFGTPARQRKTAVVAGGPKATIKVNSQKIKKLVKSKVKSKTSKKS